MFSPELMNSTQAAACCLPASFLYCVLQVYYSVVLCTVLTCYVHCPTAYSIATKVKLIDGSSR